MSGLRNATVCIAEMGTALIIPDRLSSAREYADLINEEQITIVAANPVFFSQLLLAGKSRTGAKSLHSLKLALCTGNNLTTSLRKDWKAMMNAWEEDHSKPNLFAIHVQDILLALD